MPAVISTVSLINAVVFTAYEQARRFMGVTSQEEFTLKQGIAAGGYAGLINCIPLCPQELIKCKMQWQADPNNAAKIVYKNDWDCLVKTVKFDGIRGLNRGMVITVLREVPANMGLFAGYEQSKSYFIRNNKDGKFTTF